MKDVDFHWFSRFVSISMYACTQACWPRTLLISLIFGGEQESVEDYVDLYHTVGSLMLKLGKAENAVEFLKQVLQVWSVEKNVSIAHELAEAQTLAGSHEEAEAIYRYKDR